MKLPAFLRRTPVPHVHDKAAWYGDVWDFGDPEDGTPDKHVTRWRCSCGVGWLERAPFDEFPHITAKA